jgi:6-pyruvoyltetrahydropterin/6-carboxytetrahydropterin synthase
MNITRKGNFDSMHRVDGHPGKCRNIHGHTYLYEIQIQVPDNNVVGYELDFAVLKSIVSQYIDGYLDHTSILNPADKDIIELCKQYNYKYYEMSLYGDGKYCNPTAKNISIEMFIALDELLMNTTASVSNVRLYETPNCYVDFNNKPLKGWPAFKKSKKLKTIINEIRNLNK